MLMSRLPLSLTFTQRSQLSLMLMSRSQLRLMLMSRFPLSLTSMLSPLLAQLSLMLLPQLLMLMPLLLTLLPLLVMLVMPVMPAMPELLPLLMSNTPGLMLLPPLPTDMLLTNLRMLSTVGYFYRDRLYKVHLSEWSGVWHQSAKTKSDNEKIF